MENKNVVSTRDIPGVDELQKLRTDSGWEAFSGKPRELLPIVPNYISHPGDEFDEKQNSEFALWKQFREQNGIRFVSEKYTQVMPSGNRAEFPFFNVVWVDKQDRPIAVGWCGNLGKPLYEVPGGMTFDFNWKGFEQTVSALEPEWAWTRS